MKVKEYIKRVILYIIKGVPYNYITVEVKETSPINMLSGMRILITGGSKGIGYYIARKCVLEGAIVCITGRDINALKKACDELGERCYFLQSDVKDVTNIKNMLDEAENILKGKINALISNAGISLHEGDFRNVTEDGWDAQIDTNLKGNYFLCKSYVEYLESKKDTSGNIIVITSDRGARSDDIPYGLTKIASNSFVRGFSHKIIEKGIRINAIAPGVTCSALTGRNRNENMYFEATPGKRIFLPEEIANVAKFLLSEESMCISGEIINCDQGFHIAHW